jgi:transcriptional regulator with XRE-family HTH domain
MGVRRPSQFPRTANTLRLRHLMEEAQRVQIAERIRELRERSPYTQPVVAEKLDLSLRGYQKLEERGTTKWERCEEIAELYGVDPLWIWDGTEKEAAPDVMGQLSDPAVRELSDAVAALAKDLAATRTKLLAEIGKVRRAQEALEQNAKRPGHKPGGSGRQ